jgi:hydrogenase nickel incorporation protein HypB
VLITKTDLLPYLPVDIEQMENHIHSVNPRCAVIRVSASSGDGLAAWHHWVRTQQAMVCVPDPSPLVVA